MTGTLPEGYLGADARISSGPAPELVEAGYALEIGDAGLLHRGLGLADLAHLLMLAESG
ncbi:MAG: argininosuccinate lyase, partial [Actinomycetota bacterium]|nr:argininosuccinate lyase [Actinomycetota bacterium]